MGGWDENLLGSYDSGARALWLGGQRRYAENEPLVLQRPAGGNFVNGGNGDGGLASEAELSAGQGLACAGWQSLHRRQLLA